LLLVGVEMMRPALSPTHLLGLNRYDDVAWFHSRMVCRTAGLNHPNHSTARSGCVCQGQSEVTLGIRLSDCGYEQSKKITRKIAAFITGCPAAAGIFPGL
jgi:hypothetical protein